MNCTPVTTSDTLFCTPQKTIKSVTIREFAENEARTNWCRLKKYTYDFNTQCITVFIDSYRGEYTFSNFSAQVAIKSLKKLIKHSGVDLHLTIEEVPYPTE